MPQIYIIFEKQVGFVKNFKKYLFTKLFRSTPFPVTTRNR